MLRAPAFATLVALLSLIAPQNAFADGRSDWIGYAWQQIKVANCFAVGAVLHCPPYHQKWDWKRNQWVDIAIELDLGKGELRLAQRLTNKDPRDTDWVCVTALAVDADGNNVVAHHQNLEIRFGETLDTTARYRSRRLDTATAIHIGAKQCRDGAGQDDARYARVLAGIQP